VISEGSTGTAPALVAIGAASMELAEVARLLGQLPPDFPAVVVVALHSVSTGQSDAVLRALAGATPLPCRYAADNEPLIAGHVYVAPIDRHLVVQGDRMRVVFGPKENGHRPALDPLLRTAAHEWRSRTVGVVLCGLSGQIMDGLSGLWQVKENGGTVVLPHPAGTDPIATAATAVFQRVAPDFTPVPEELPALLLKLASDPHHVRP